VGTPRPHSRLRVPALRALAWLLTTITTLAVYTDAHPAHPATPSAPSFNPVAYAIDVALPTLDLGQQKALIASGPGQWVNWAVALAGWILATTVVAAVSRTLTRE